MATTSIRPEPPLIVIVGPTASGKTALAVELAEQFKGEIICADSRTVYRGMDIGTAKPTHEERARVPHWGLDLVEPNEKFSAADFKRYAESKIEEIRARGHIPFLVGGTGLYVDAIIFDYQFGKQANLAVRKTLDALSVEELQQYCNKNNINLPENSKNKRYLIRAIEQKSINTKRRQSPVKNCYIVGITTDKTILRTRIETRAEQLLRDGVVDEATILGKKYGWDNEAMTGNIYPLVHQHLMGLLSLSEVKAKFTTIDWRLAKRQLTWLKRNTFIEWFELQGAHDYLIRVLANL
jgi:tRNA dimethylallyltransferase